MSIYQETGDSGEIWFGQDAESKMIQWIKVDKSTLLFNRKLFQRQLLFWILDVEMVI